VLTAEYLPKSAKLDSILVSKKSTESLRDVIERMVMSAPAMFEIKTSMKIKPTPFSYEAFSARTAHVVREEDKVSVLTDERLCTELNTLSPGLADRLAKCDITVSRGQMTMFNAFLRAKSLAYKGKDLQALRNVLKLILANFTVVNSSNQKDNEILVVLCQAIEDVYPDVDTPFNFYEYEDDDEAGLELEILDDVFPTKAKYTSRESSSSYDP